MPRRFLLCLLFVLTGGPRVDAGDGRRVLIDIKSPVAEAADLAAASLGTAIRLRESGWARTVEFGEDYALWLRDYERRDAGDSIEVSLTVELRRPSVLRTGTLIQRRRVVVRYRDQADWAGVSSVEQAVRRELENQSREFAIEAAAVGARLADVVHEWLGPGATKRTR